MMIMGERSVNKSTKAAGWISRWKQLAGCFLLVSLLVSCSIENDIPYPIVEASIESMVVEGQRSADANKFVEATINKSARTVTIYVNDSVDITKLKITSLKITSGAELIPDSSACNNFDKFPTSGFASLDSIPMSSNTRMDFSKPVTFTLRTYQDYVWTVSVTQIIDRDIEVTGMTDYVVDVNSCIVSIFVKGQDLSDLSVSKLNIGGEYGDVQPDPTTVKDYSSSVKFNVKYSWEENYTPWTVIVYEDEEGGSGAGTSADIFPMVSRAYLKGSIQVGKTPEIEYAKENGAEYICVMIHWGDAISSTVSEEQKSIADFLVESGVNLIIGAHPSVVQPMEVRQNADGDNVFIAYSIGTYVSTLSAEEARTELVLNIELRKSGKDGKVYLNKVDYTPIYMLDSGENAQDTQNRFKLIDMKSTATSYADGNTEIVTRETYDKLVSGLNRLNDILSP